MNCCWPIFAVLITSLLSGCAAITNPVVNGVPVSRLPTELLSGPRRENLQTIPLTLLSQPPPDEYLLEPGDVLGVYVEGVFPATAPDQNPAALPVNFPSRIDPLGAGLPPSVGYPIRIRKDGTVTLPLVDPITVDGLTVGQANEKIRRIYLDGGYLQEGRETILVSLMQPRQTRVMVFRQEVGGFAAGGRGDIAANNFKQGTGHVIDLRAYENDVLNALANTGGLPGLDTMDDIFIFRRGQQNAALTESLAVMGSDENPLDLAELGVDVVRIPTRWPVGEPLPIKAEDILLQTGDVVFVESRTNDFFYTGGLLPSGEHKLPRDYDLDVVEAVTQVRGTLLNGAFGGSNLSGEILEPGIGNPNPSALTVIRRTPTGGQVPIRVDLNRALRDARERILVQPGDLLILQETPGEAIARYMSDVVNFTFVGRIINRGSATGVVTTSVP